MGANVFLLAVTWWKLVLAAVSGFFGGGLVVTSGGGSFITYPFLLAIGEPSTVANATSTMGLFAGWITSIPQFRKEIRSQGKIVRVLVLPAFFGAVLGSYVLTKTPASVFSLIAPILIFVASLALQFRLAIVRWGEKIHIRTHKSRMIVISFLTFFVCSYSSFFGAGVGILMLACLSIMNIEHMMNNIAIKNALAVIASSVAVVYFLSVGLINVPAALAIACGSIPGSYFGSRAVRVIDEHKLRRFTVIYGVCASIVILTIRLA